jgi:hypothetical protein
MLRKDDLTPEIADAAMFSSSPVTPLVPRGVNLEGHLGSADLSTSLLYNDCFTLN